MKLKLFSFIICAIVSMASFGQYIPTAVPFLSKNANPRYGGIADIGVVSSELYTDRSSLDNPGLFSVSGKKITTNLSILPYKSEFLKRIYIIQFNVVYRINKKNTISTSTRYFSLGEVTFSDVAGNITGVFNPYEFAQDIRLSHAFSDNWSSGISVKYFISDIAVGPYVQGSNSGPINSCAFDLGVVYKSKSYINDTIDINYSFGASVMNFGPRVAYVDDPEARKDFIPTQLQLGFLLGPKFKLNSNSSLNIDFLYQLEKQLVPSPPKYLMDDNGLVVDENGNQIIESGKDPDISPFIALYQSFYDAPDGFKEFDEYVHRTGIELRWNNGDTYFLALRLGKIFSHDGNDKISLNTIGLGVGILDLSINYRTIISDEPYTGFKNAIGIGIRI